MSFGVLASTMTGLALMSAQAGQPTPPPFELDQILKATGFIYKDDGSFIDFKLTFTDTKRSHKVFVRKTPDEYRSVRVNEVYGLVFESVQEPSKEIVSKVFEKRYSIGALVLEKPSERQKFWRIRYRLEFHSGWSADKFRDIANIVAGTADALERELSGTGEDLL